MNKQVILGQVRELVFIVSAFFIATGEGVEVIAAIGTALASLIWAIYYHEGKQKIFTAIRKLIPTIPAALVAFHVIPPDKAIAIAGALAAGVSLTWSFISNGGKVKAGSQTPMLFFALCFLPSCGVSVVDEAPEGSVRLPNSQALLTRGEDGKAKVVADGQTVLTWAGKITRILAGESARDVILPPASTSTAQK